MRYVLDTSALLAHYRREAGWPGVQAPFEADKAEFYQLLFAEIAAVDAAVARAAFVLSCRTPRRLPLVDALIAAVAQIKGATLVHRNEHMRSLPADWVSQQDLEASATAS